MVVGTYSMVVGHANGAGEGVYVAAVAADGELTSENGGAAMPSGDNPAFVCADGESGSSSSMPSRGAARVAVAGRAGAPSGLPNESTEPLGQIAINVCCLEYTIVIGELEAAAWAKVECSWTMCSTCGGSYVAGCLEYDSGSLTTQP